MNNDDKVLRQVFNQRALADYVIRAQETINKFRNSRIEATLLKVYSDDGGEYIYLDDLETIKRGLLEYSDFLTEKLACSPTFTGLRSK